MLRPCEWVLQRLFFQPIVLAEVVRLKPRTGYVMLRPSVGEAIKVRSSGSHLSSSFRLHPCPAAPNTSYAPNHWGAERHTDRRVVRDGILGGGRPAAATSRPTLRSA